VLRRALAPCLPPFAALADESGLLSRDESGLHGVDESQNFLSGGMLVHTMIGVRTD
jgi:hypothetical protein